MLEVLLASLPAPERQSVGYVEGTGEDELIAQLRSRLERTWEFAETLPGARRRPWFNPPRRVADGRVGYPLSGERLRSSERG